MQCPDFPENEQERLKALHDTGLLDTLPEERFDRFTRLAKQLFDVPYAVISLIDGHRQWFKSKQGLDVSETGRDVSFCGHTILQDDIFEVTDASKDPRFSDNPLVTGFPNIRFYAGAQIYSKEGFALGTLCLIDTKPRQLSKQERSALNDFSKSISNEIASEFLKSVLKERQLLEKGPFINFEFMPDEHLSICYVSKNVETILGYSAHELIEKHVNFVNLIHAEDKERNAKELTYLLTSTKSEFEHSFRLTRNDGTFRWFAGYLNVERNQSNEAVKVRAHLSDQTRIKINELELKKERRRLADIIEGTRIGTWEWNVKTGETRFNKRWADIVGYKLSELEPTSIDTWINLAHPEDLEKSNELLTEVLEGRAEYYDIECRMRHKDGRWVWVHDRGKVVIRGPDGEPLWMSGTHADISEKKRAEIGLVGLSDFQNLVFENLPLYLFVKDEQFRIVMINKHVYDLYPKEQHEKIVGYTTLEAYKEEERNAFLEEDKKAFRDGYSETEETIQFPSGDIRTLWTKKIRFENQAGEKFILVLASDITESKKQQETSNNLRKNLMLSKDAAGLGVIVWDVENNTLTADEKICELYGLPKKTIEQNGISSWLNTIHPDDKKRVEADLESVINGEPNHDSTFRIVKPSGEIVHIKAAGLMEYDESGKPTKMIRTNLDITSLKQTEEALLLAKQTAEKATRSKSEFLANMSHEIRTPINGIMGMLTLGIRDCDDATNKRRLTLAKESATTLLTIVDDILDFSKIEAGKLTFEEIEFDLLKLIENFAQANAQSAHDRSLELVLDIQNMPYRFVVGDPSRLKQILSNLYSNAVKFTDEGHIHITCDLTESNNGTLIFSCSVSDTGIGIPDSKIATVFENFTQADNSTTRLYGGSGLGLSIVQYLCQKMGGDIRAQSKLGSGSTFSFEVELQKSAKNIETFSKNSAEQKTILVLEPHEASRFVLKQNLCRWGLTVTAFKDIHDFIADDSAQSQIFDLVLIDQKLVTSYKQHVIQTETAHVACIDKAKLIILTSAHISNNDARFRGLDNCGTLMKPVTQSDLWDAIVTKDEPGPDAGRARKETSVIHFNDNVKVLLVEDNAINREVAGDYLEDVGLNYECAINGEEALDKLLTQSDFSLILMDCQMPILDGYDATRWIRTGKVGDAYTNIPIIALTANAMQGDKSKCINAGMNDYLSKPISPEALIEKIWNTLGKPKETKMTQPSENSSAKIEDVQIWDKAALLERVRGKQERMERLVTLFINEIEERYAMFDALKQNFDLDKAIFFTHSLKGNAATLSCHALTEVAKKAEQAGRDGNSEAVMALLPEIKTEFDKVAQAFRAHFS